MNPCFHSIEVLEVRIAPASVFITYTDLDGDLVKIKATNISSVPAPLDLSDLTFVGGGTSGQLAKLDLTDVGFAGASIFFSVTKMPGGNGFADVGRIDATGISLGTVKIKGDLGVLDAGSGIARAVENLAVRSFGLFGIATQGGVGDLTSNLNGSLGSLTVFGDFQNAFLQVAGSDGAGIGKILIKGSLIGGLEANSGKIRSVGDIGTVMIGGDVVGGGGANSGAIALDGKLTSLTVKGSIIGRAGGYSDAFTGKFTEGQVAATGVMQTIKVGRNVVGGDGFASGEIRSEAALGSVTITGSLIGGVGLAGGHLAGGGFAGGGSIGTVKIGGDVIGGRGAYTGFIESFGSMGTVTVRGSVIGGPNYFSGVISCGTDMAAVKIGGDLIGGSINGSEPTFGTSGVIESFGGKIARVTIGGSVLAGVDNSPTGSNTYCGAILAVSDIGSITIKGNVIGSMTVNGKNPVIIAAYGSSTPSDKAVSIGEIRIGGRVENTVLAAGVLDSVGYNGNAQIGAVTVGGDWIASSLVAGIRDAGANGFGNLDDVAVPSPVGDGLVSRIASVTIRGFVAGTTAPGDQYGFTAQQIGSFKAGGKALVLTAGTDGIIPLASLTGDMHLREAS